MTARDPHHWVQCHAVGVTAAPDFWPADLECDGFLPYIIMEPARGEELASVLEGGREARLPRLRDALLSSQRTPGTWSRHPIAFFDAESAEDVLLKVHKTVSWVPGTQNSLIRRLSRLQSCQKFMGCWAWWHWEGSVAPSTGPYCPRGQGKQEVFPSAPSFG